MTTTSIVFACVTLAFTATVVFLTLKLVRQTDYLSALTTQSNSMALYEQKIRHFQLLFKLQKSDLSHIIRPLVNLTSDLQRERVFGDNLPREFQVQDMIIRASDSWRSQDPSHKLCKLKDVRTVVEPAPSGNSALASNASIESHEYVKDKLLPDPAYSMWGNLFLHTSDRSFDAPSYALACLPDGDLFSSTGPQPVLKIREGTYFDFIDTCVPFAYEAADATPQNQIEDPYELRRKYGVGDLSNRYAQLGVVTLVAFRNVRRKNEYRDYFLLHRRSDDVSESAGLLNVVPAGTLAPSNANAPTDRVMDESEFVHSLDDACERRDRGKAEDTEANSRLLTTLVREFCEEIHGTEEFSELTRDDEVRDRIEWRLLADTSYMMGLAFNPLTLHVEILALSVIDVNTNSAAQELFGRDSSGFVTKQAILSYFHPNYEGSIKLIKLDRTVLRHYEHQYKSSPSLRQLCKIISDNYDAIFPT